MLSFGNESGCDCHCFLLTYYAPLLSLSKRDTAVFAIAQSVGLRAIDIVNLKLVNINWNSHEIRFCQHKTGVELVLPLEPAVGNAIADYILNERPKAQSEFLFVRARFPYGAMTSNAVGDRLM